MLSANAGPVTDNRMICASAVMRLFKTSFIYSILDMANRG
ncbi:hypothetical protein OKW12_000643 [Pseudomonas silensiensis]|nr:hypothetical protein [Pseudomonas silensiensis]